MTAEAQLHTDPDPSLVGWLLAAQNVLHILPTDSEVCDFVGRALGGLPGVRDCQVELQSRAYDEMGVTRRPPTGAEAVVAGVDEVSGDREEVVGSRFSPSLADGFPPAELVMLPGQTALRLPLRATDGCYGLLKLQVDDQRQLAPYLSFLGIFAASLALLLENRSRGRSLEESNRRLERTMLELGLANEELQRQTEALEQSARLGQALNLISASIASTSIPEEVLRRVVQKGAEALGCPRAVLKIYDEDQWAVGEVYGLPESLRGLPLVDEEVLIAGVSDGRAEVVVIEDARADPRVHPDSIERYGTRAALVVPLLLRNQVLGQLQFIYVDGPRSFRESEIDFVRKLGASSVLALENAALLAAERHIAEVLQAGLLNIPDRVSAVECGHLYRSATDEAKVGGDFYDLFPLDEDRVAVVVGDVSGHGVEAAWMASAARDTIRAYAYQSGSPSAILLQANQALLKNQAFSGFATVFLGVLDLSSSELTYCPAGHPPAMVRRADGVTRALSVGGPPLGALEEADYRLNQEKLRPGDVLLVYTDGLVEARTGREFYGEERLREAFRELGALPLEALPQALLDRVAGFCGGHFRDDVALLAVQLAFAPEV